jgi:hypothetical protein
MNLQRAALRGAVLVLLAGTRFPAAASAQLANDDVPLRLHIQRGHLAAVQCVAGSADGKGVVTGGSFLL